ncbi:MAG: LLM class F420-dependent oxidoreductase [Gaiellales bacterium]
MHPATNPVTRLGLQISSFTYPDVPDAELFAHIADIAVTAEESGFDSVWVMDHFYQIAVNGPSEHPMLEAYTLLAGVAARTRQVSLGGMVTGVTYRNPAMLAKIVTTLDIVSSGRAILGIGAAWNDEEHRGYGFEFPPLKERFERLEDALQICRAMFTETEATVHGRHHHVERALNYPRPIRPGGPPILVGGSGERKTIPLLARYADACNFFGDVDTVRHKVDVLERSCEEIGRDPAEITKTRLGSLVIADSSASAERKAESLLAAGLPPARLSTAVRGDPDAVLEQVDAFLEAGMDGLLFNLPDVYDLETVALAGRTLATRLGTPATA